MAMKGRRVDCFHRYNCVSCDPQDNCANKPTGEFLTRDKENYNQFVIAVETGGCCASGRENCTDLPTAVEFPTMHTQGKENQFSLVVVEENVTQGKENFRPGRRTSDQEGQWGPTSCRQLWKCISVSTCCHSNNLRRCQGRCNI